MHKAITLLLCAGLNFSGWAAWPTFHGAPNLSGTADADWPDEPQLLWRYLGPGAVYNPPVSDGQRICFASQKGTVTALDLQGRELWSHQLVRTNHAGQVMAARLDAPLAIRDGLVFAATSRGILYALDAVSGKEQWRYETDGVLIGSPNFIGTQTVVVIDQSTGILHAVELKNGQKRWTTDEVERCDGSPGIGAGHIVFGSCLGALHVYDLQGNHLHDIEVGGDSQLAGGAAVDGMQVFAGTRDGRLVCASLETGEPIWSVAASEGQAFATPAVTDDEVVHATDDGWVYAVDRSDGKISWRFEAGGLPDSPVIAGERVAVSADGTLFVLNVSDGSRSWSKAISDDITAPAIIRGMLVVGADDGSVSAFGRKEKE